MADRNEVLANFQVSHDEPLTCIYGALIRIVLPPQALSNIEDIAICLDILEQKGWDLMVLTGVCIGRVSVILSVCRVCVCVVGSSEQCST